MQKKNLVKNRIKNGVICNEKNYIALFYCIKTLNILILFQLLYFGHFTANLWFIIGLETVRLLP